jgi:serine/threonine protein kinase
MSLPDPAKGKGANDPNATTREDVVKEIDILAACDHPNVMYLKEYFEESNKVYLITGECKCAGLKWRGVTRGEG